MCFNLYNVRRDGASAAFSQDPVQVLRHNPPLFSSADVPHHPADTTQMNHKTTTDSITGMQTGHLPHSRHFLLQQLDDITTVKTDVICTGHAALHHDSVPARHLEIKQPHNWAFPAYSSATTKFQTRILLLPPLRLQW